MKKTIVNSLIVSAISGVIFSMIYMFLSATYYQKSDVLGIDEVLTGYNAIRAMIDAFGVGGLVMSLAGTSLLFFFCSFISCLIVGYLGVSRK